ncbi:MAG TPA: alpha/beta hydrolase [Candidatus Kapabacteria bacterium]|nr:alpha/beta hydrolase [Candidatus Kapabacteria bacterium]
MNAEQQLIHEIHVPVQTRTDSFGDKNIHYAVSGKGNPLLLLHGANIGWGQWYKNIAYLSQFFQVYALDLPGSGGSTKIDFHKANLEQDFIAPVEQFIQRHQLHRISIIGHSFGGWIAFQIAKRKNVFIQKIVAVAPVGCSKKVPVAQFPITIYPIAGLIAKTAMKPTEQNLKKFLESAFYDKMVLEDVLVRYFYEGSQTAGSSHPLLFLNRMTDPFRIKGEVLLEKIFPAVEQPCLIVWGGEDHLLPSKQGKEMCSLLPNGHIVLMPDTGHVPFIEQPEIFHSHISHFLDLHTHVAP